MSRLILLCALFFSVPMITSAQMFSVDDSPGPYEIPGIALFAGFEPINFEYEGSPSVPGAGTYEFSGNLIRFKLESPGIEVYLGTAGSLTGLEELSYFDAGIKFGYGITIYRTEKVFLQLPLQLHSSFTSVNNDELVVNPAPEFREGTFELGTGLDLNARIASKTRLGVNVVPRYGFAFSTRERDAGGRIAAVEGQGRLYFDQLFGNAGLSVGYDYELRSFDIDGEALDYTATTHSILIGITF